MSTAVIDYETLGVLDELFGNDLYLTDLFPPYRDQVGIALKSLANAISNQDGKGVIFHAHSLKSSSAQLGALRVSSICQLLENLGLALDWPVIGETFNQLQTATSAAVSELGSLEEERRMKAA